MIVRFRAGLYTVRLLSETAFGTAYTITAGWLQGTGATYNDPRDGCSRV
jgi:hypothetical protein